MAMNPRAEHPLDFWHLGDGEDFFDAPQWEHWALIAQSLERDGDASVIVEFMRHQTKPILPGLAKIIARLWAGECFHRDDGWPLHVDGLKVLGPKCPPLDPDKAEKLRRAAMLVEEVIEQGVGKDNALKGVAEFLGLTQLGEIRAVLADWKRWRAEE